MAFQLPALPYAYNALEPHIDARTMEIHHTKHHQAYVNGLNAALEGQAALGSKSVEDLLRGIATVPESIKQAVINHGGGHANHSLFWQTLSASGGGKPSGALASAIDASFGGFDGFKEQFTKAATTRFGSGWAWLALDGSKKLSVFSTPNQDSPYMQGQTPILGLDVWEHAYYLNYQNRRPDYIAAFWNVVHWKHVAELYEKAKG